MASRAINRAQLETALLVAENGNHELLEEASQVLARLRFFTVTASREWGTFPDWADRLASSALHGDDDKAASLVMKFASFQSLTGVINWEAASDARKAAAIKEQEARRDSPAPLY